MIKNRAKLLVFAIFSALLLPAFIGACGNVMVEGQSVVLKAGHAVDSSHPYHLGLVEFARLIETRTNGKYKIDIYPSAQLGNERDMIEGLQLGTLDFVVTSTGPISNFLPKMGIVDLPYLFRSRQHAYTVLDGPIGKSLLDGFKGKKIVGMAFWENGFRCITNSKRPIETPQDLKNLKIRTMENPVHIATFKCLGASPTPMAWSEVFTSLQQGVLDGQENPISIIYHQRIYEVQKYLSITDHFYSPSLLLMSEKSFNKFSPEEREIFKKAAIEAGNFERGLIREDRESYIGILEERGMEITWPDKEAFMAATEPMYKLFEGKFGKEIIGKIRATEAK